MHARPFALLGAATLDSVRARVEAALDDWRRDWGLSLPVSVSCTRAWEPVSPDASASSTAPPVRRFFEGASGSMRMEWREETARLLRHAMFPDYLPGDAGKGRGPVAHQAGEQALVSLAGRMAELLSPTAGAVHAAGPWVESAGLHGSGAVLAVIACAGPEITCLFDHAAARALHGAQPPARSVPGSRANLADALKGVAVSLPVTVGRAEADLGSLMSLAVGDVIRLDAPIEQPLAVCTPHGKRVLQAYLGRVGRDIAVEVIAGGNESI